MWHYIIFSHNEAWLLWNNEDIQIQFPLSGLIFLVPCYGTRVRCLIAANLKRNSQALNRSGCHNRAADFFNCTSFCLAPFPPFLFLRKSDSGFAPKNLFFSKWMTYPCCHNCIVVILTANLHHDPRVMLQFSLRFKWSLAFWREKQNRYPLFSLILLRVLWLDLGFERLRRSPLYSDDSCEDSLTLCNGAQETKRLAFSHNHFFRIDAKDLLHYCSSACTSTRTMRKRHNHTVGRCHL